MLIYSSVEETQQKKTCYADGEKGVDLVGELYRFRSKGQGEQ